MASHASLIPASIHETFGAGLIGAFVNAMMYGITTLQTYLFFLYYPNDSRGNKLLVSFLWITDTIHTVLASWCIYLYLVSNYDNPQGLKKGHWTLFASIVCNVLIACVVQSYFTFRIFQLSGPRTRWWLGSIIGITVLAHFVFGIETVVFCFIKEDFDRLHEFALIAATPFAITAVLSDVLIAGSLCVLLHGSRSGFKGTNALVTMLIIYAINRCLLTSAVAVVEVIVFSLRPNALWYLAIDFVIGKLYANSLLATLNSRIALSNRAGQAKTTTIMAFTSDIEFENRQVAGSQGHTLRLNEDSTTSNANRLSKATYPVDAKSQHVYVTGGSQGLGFAVAEILVQKGAHVSIVARRQERLDQALVQLEKHRQTPGQIIQAKSFTLATASSSTAALEAVCEAHHGEAPDAVFACAGTAKPLFFLDMTEEDLTNGMTNGYWLQAWTAWATAKMMAKQKKEGKIVLVASMLGYMSFVGWASYAPAKHGLRGLADTLQSELMLYKIDVQIFFPPTMYSPGFEEENKSKPQLLKDIEGTDEGLTPHQAALKMLQGVQNGDVHISADIFTSIFRAATRGATYRTNYFLDALLDFVAFVATPVWRASVDRQVVAHREAHEEYLQQKGFYSK